MTRTLKRIGWAFFLLGIALCYVAAVFILYWMVWLILLCWGLCAVFHGIARSYEQDGYGEANGDIKVDAESGEVFSPKGHQGTVKFR